jgi:hypothetical protein
VHGDAQTGLGLRTDVVVGIGAPRRGVDIQDVVKVEAAVEEEVRLIEVGYAL